MTSAAPIYQEEDEEEAEEKSTMLYGRMALWDRALRFLLALGMLGLGWIGPEIWVGLRVLALYPLFTAAVGWCPAYALLRRGMTKND